MPKEDHLGLRTFLGRLLAAVVLGTATLLVMKPDPEAHWATPPVSVIRVRMHHVMPAEQLRRAGLRFDLYAVG